MMRNELQEGWEFTRTGLGGPWEAWRATLNPSHHEVPWERVKLPHCVNALDGVDPDVKYYQGPAWYRRWFSREEVEKAFPSGRILLHFGGASQNTTVYCGTAEAGFHQGGYDEFTVDITEGVDQCLADPRWRGRVPLAICCDNSRELNRIPSDLSDFSLYGGLVRPVRMRHVPAVSMQSLLVRTEVEEGRASASVSMELYNPTGHEATAALTVELLDPRGCLLRTHETTLSTGRSSGELGAFTVGDPELWSPDSPSLYRIRVRMDCDGNSTTMETRFGFRSFEFIPHGPFMLNGRRLLLRGTHRHEDHAGLGAAMPADLIREEMELMKEMGVNFIRLGHYQQSREVLNLCDELGILVWEEIPWCRGGLGDETYREQCRRMLRNMITQHVNHPSVILWGLGNENDWEGDFEHFDEQEIRGFMSELHQLSHQLDPSRMTAIRRCDFCKDVVDVYSPSIWAGWYRGKFTDYKAASRSALEEVDHMLHVEWGGDNHAGRHAEDPYAPLKEVGSDTGADEREGDYLLVGGDARVSRDGDWSETYFCDLVDWHLKEQETMDWLTGAAQWPFKDFCTPLRPENPVPYVNQKGVVARDLTRKEGYFVFQSYWTEVPMVHIYGRSWPVRWGREGQKRLVRVYSNCREVELFLDGQSLGRRERDSQDYPCAGLRWEIPMTGGGHQLEAHGFKDGAVVTDRLAFRYETRPWGQPASVALEVLESDAESLLVEGLLLDENGVICLDSGEAYAFAACGAGRLLDNQGTPWGSRKGQLANGRARIRVLRSGPGPVAVSFGSGGFTALAVAFPDE
jgi:beta-galactosidase